MQQFRQVATDLAQAWGRHLQRNRTSGYDVPSSPTLIVYIAYRHCQCQVDLVRGTCLEIEPYMFEPVCQSGESESNDSHADTDSDSDTDGDMYRGLAHQPVQLWCECRLSIPAWLRSVMSPSSGTSRVAL